AGHIVGATPWNQPVMLMVGVGSAAVVLAPVLVLIEKAYGIGIPTPEHPNPLAAPQATLMASVAEGVFSRDLPWRMIIIGMILAIAVISLDRIQERKGALFRLPVLAVAVGVYLPFELSVPIFAGGMVNWMVNRNKQRPEKAKTEIQENRGLLFASGLITGEAIVGILMAIPIVVAGDRNVLAVVEEPLGTLPGIVLLLTVVVLLYKVASKNAKAS
ncbi:MAG: OPT/YSL family transporter, partial [Fidelibacterota bacterium]